MRYLSCICSVALLAGIAVPAGAEPPGPVMDVLEANESPRSGVARTARKLRDEMEQAPGPLPDMSPLVLEERPVAGEAPEIVDFDPAPPVDEAHRGFDRRNDNKERREDRERDRDKDDGGRRGGGDREKGSKKN